MRVTIVTLDSHLAGVVARARAALRRELPGLVLDLHAASDWEGDAAALERCLDDIARADIVVATMLFMDDHIAAVRAALEARRDTCDAMVCAMSAGEVMRLTRIGAFRMDGTQRGPLSLLRRLRGARRGDRGDRSGGKVSSGARQMAMLRRLPRLLRFIPGTAQDVRAYFLTLQYWLAGTDENVASLVRFLVNRYADGPRRALRGAIAAAPPVEHAETGLYHPRMKGRVAERAARLPGPAKPRGRVGLLLMRSYVLAGDTGHYDGVIEALEAAGLAAVPAFVSGLDAREAIERFFLRDGAPTVDAVVSLTGFSLVGGPAYNDAEAAVRALRALDVPYLLAHPVEFQSLEEWRGSERGLHPVESTMMVALPELDGATAPTVIGGRAARTSGDGEDDARAIEADPSRCAALAARVAKLVALRRAPREERRVAVVLFNFPPNAGSTGTAAHLSVYESLHRTLERLGDEGYAVGDLPDSADALRERILGDGSSGADAAVHARVSVDDHVRRERWLEEIESAWGPAPGRHQSDGESIHVLGARFGNVLVGVQPAFGYEGDPMRLLFERGFAPTHAFSAFYRYLREDFGAHAVLHFGTHGALEFMPGKQTGLGEDCWPERLIGDLPNLYLYTANNPSEGAIAKRRSAATLVSYLTPPLMRAGLYRGLLDLRDSLDRLRALAPEAHGERARLVEVVQAAASELDLADAEPAWDSADPAPVDALARALHELEESLVPDGLHVVGAPPSEATRADLLDVMADAAGAPEDVRAAVPALVAGSPASELVAAGTVSAAHRDALDRLASSDRLLREDHELPALVAALDGRYVPPAPAGDLVTTPEILPTGRNLHGFDPYRIPSAFAVAEGQRLAELLLARHREQGAATPPELVALVLWGTDNLKSQGGPLAQALALMGARPRLDGYGRVAGATLIPLAELGRPRIDVMVTLSGIFRDLLPLQTRMLAEAAFLAASADEPLERNFVRKHALRYQAAHGCDLETASLRVFSNANGAYGSNVNHMVDAGCWDEEDELAETYVRRKSFAYGRAGAPVRRPELLESVLGDVTLAYQNLESVELGVTTVDHYFDTLGGLSRAVRRSRGDAVPVYIADQTRGGDGTVRTLAEQVALETRTRALNPRWQEGMLEHGYEGVRQIEVHVTNTMGWSATTGQVAPWVYRKLTETFVLDEEMRARMAALNPVASAKVAHRLIEAHERDYWQPDAATLEALQRAGDELEDRVEGVGVAA